ncbi:MAG TPA: hypothetical protein VGN74_05440 [Brevundimonas sp.]|jgi:hypothetical protein|uniref:hypothetical protein n=1 Tax=Brevundimonas sp. TaxID=1871086 RepID=UPI002E1285C2|nr:hypothetical protein [Brevundimonas sp.]
MGVRPTIIRDDETLVAILRGRRLQLGIGQAELDDMINWPDGYTAKVEAPGRKYGRRSLWGLSSFLNYWLESLGLALVVMDRAEAERLAAASDAPPAALSSHDAYAGRTRKREVVQHRVLRVAYVFPGGRKAA